MDAEIMVEMLPQLGVCNLCLNEGPVKSMLIGYKHNGVLETYNDMLMKCFSIDLSLLHLGDVKRVICELCIARLRDSMLFKKQVEVSLQNLEASVKLNKDEKEIVDGIKDEPTAVALYNDDFPGDNDDADAHVHKHEKEIVDGMKDEPTAVAVFNDDFPGDDEDDGEHKDEKEIVDGIKDEPTAVAVFNDDFPGDDEDDGEHIILADIKKEPTECRRKGRSKPLSKKLKVLNKVVDIKETEIMLETGLFPFKLRKTRGSFTCSICPEKSNNLDDLKAHILDHTKTNIHLAFKKMMFSNSHRFFKSGTSLRCKICTTDITNYEELKQHIEHCTTMKYSGRKWNNLPFKLEKDQLDCPVCKKTFLNFVNLNTHMNVHYPNYICESCGKAFASKARLKGHVRTHEVGTFTCKYCPAVFDRVTKRENHVSKEHKSGVRYACKRCNISLTSFYARQKHLAEVHNEELKRYKCKICPQSYITPGHLSSHVRRDHLNERNHKCDKCDLAFYTKNSLKMHMIKHDGERIHTCHICQKSYQRKKTLREHLRIHNNDKRFICPVCGRAFTQKCTLKGHLKVHERKSDEEDRASQPLHSI